jgi:hypothetical protein
MDVGFAGQAKDEQNVVTPHEEKKATSWTPYNCSEV